MGIEQTPGIGIMDKTESEEELKPPKRYTVILHNDHYTTQEFVTWILVTVFGLSEMEAFRKMLDVHRAGKGQIGDYSYDVAQSKAMTTERLAKENEFPLKATVEQLT